MEEFSNSATLALSLKFPSQFRISRINQTVFRTTTVSRTRIYLEPEVTSGSWPSMALRTPKGQENCTSFGGISRCIAVQTECGKKNKETITDKDAEQVLKELVKRREQLKDSYQDVLDKQTQAENQLQVQIKQLKQQQEEEMQRYQETVKSIQDVTVKRRETRKKMDKENKEQSQKAQDLNSELEKMQAKRDRLQEERDEQQKKIECLLMEQTKEKEEWDAELASLKKLEIDVTQSAQEEGDRALRAEVLSLESRRELLLISLEEAESEAEVTLSLLRVANPTLEWIQLKQKWEARLAGIQQMKANLWDQFESQIRQVRSGSKLTSLSSILAPSLPAPPCDTNLMLQRIALTQMPIVPLQPPGFTRDPFHLQSQLPNVLQCQPIPPLPHLSGPFPGAVPVLARAAGATPLPSTNEVSVPPADKLSQILEKLQARFPQCTKPQLTMIMQKIKVSRGGTLYGLTVEELCQLVGTRLKETDAVSLPAGNSKMVYPTPTGAFVSPPQRPFLGRLPQHSAPCLICQKLVLPSDLKPMSCNHVMHQKCIAFWAETNQKDSCPFCSNQR
ncbi:RING finger protein 214 [Pelodytes ibericus]